MLDKVPFVTVRAPMVPRLAELLMSEALVFRGANSELLPDPIKGRIQGVEDRRAFLYKLEAAKRFEPEKKAKIQLALLESIRRWGAFESYLGAVEGLDGEEAGKNAELLRRGLFRPGRRFFRVKAVDHWVLAKFRLDRMAEDWAPWVTGLGVERMVERLAEAHAALGTALKITGPFEVPAKIDVNQLYVEHLREIRLYILEVTTWAVMNPEHEAHALALLEPLHKFSALAKEQRNKAKRKSTDKEASAKVEATSSQ